MERVPGLMRAKEIMKENFIGIEELSSIQEQTGLLVDGRIKENIPVIPFSEEELISCKDDHILLLGGASYKDGTEVTLLKMRDHLGKDPNLSEPCFYNQDWYDNEVFAKNTSPGVRWYFFRKHVLESSRGKAPQEGDGRENLLPTAVECTYAFFVYYFLRKEYLWKHDYVWCSDKDAAGDRIYVGRYLDKTGKTKNGFSIHRHLSIKNNYGCL